MIAQRAGMTALGRVAAAARPTTSITAQNRLIKASWAMSSSTARTSPITTEQTTPATGQALLAAQRRQRPVSPHLAIYDPQQTWFVGSIWQRLTGAAFTGALYGGGAAYLAAPLLGWHLESASLAAAFAAWPLAARGAAKLAVAWAFAWHLLSGVKHCANDVGYGYARASMKAQGWALWGVSLAAGAYCAFGL